jgi:serine/threonine-protein kinase RsbW
MAKHSGGETETADRILDSTLTSVDAAEALALRIAARAGFSEDDQNAIGMAVRECMVNAVVHGNQYSEHKKVHLFIASSPDRLTINIQDEGSGFDPESLPDPLAPENLLRQSGRGIFIVRAFMDEVLIRRREDSGMSATLVKYRVSKTP